MFFGLLLPYSTLPTLKGTQALKETGLREISVLALIQDHLAKKLSHNGERNLASHMEEMRLPAKNVQQNMCFSLLFPETH